MPIANGGDAACISGSYGDITAQQPFLSLQIDRHHHINMEYLSNSFTHRLELLKLWLRLLRWQIFFMGMDQREWP